MCKPSRLDVLIERRKAMIAAKKAKERPSPVIAPVIHKNVLKVVKDKEGWKVVDSYGTIQSNDENYDLIIKEIKKRYHSGLGIRELYLEYEISDIRLDCGKYVGCQCVIAYYCHICGSYCRGGFRERHRMCEDCQLEREDKTNIRMKLKREGLPPEYINSDVVEMQYLMLKTKREIKNINQHDSKNQNPSRRHSGVK